MSEQPPADMSEAASTTTRLVRCREHEPIRVPLELVMDANGRLDLNPEVEGRDYFAVSLSKTELTLRARSVVGFIPLNDRVVVHVRPRVPVSNLARLVEVSGTPATPLTSMQEYEGADEWRDSLLDLYATTLIHHVDVVISAGFLRDYVRRQEVSSFPRGRVLMHQTLGRLHPRGIRHAAEVAWYERTVDTAPNRAIKYALWLLAQRYIALGAKDRTARGLHRALGARYHYFDGVALDHDRSFLHDELVIGSRQPPSLRAYYRDALEVSRAIVTRQGIKVDGTKPGGIRLPSIVINMAAVFEGYVRNILAQHAHGAGWEVRVVDGNLDGRKKLFDALPSPSATPDAVLRAPDGTTPVVIEVKNVPVRDVFSERDAMNQAATYAASYRARCALLVHPRVSEHQPGGMHKLGTIADVELWQYRFDLGASDLVEEDALFGRAVRALIAMG